MTQQTEAQRLATQNALLARGATPQEFQRAGFLDVADKLGQFERAQAGETRAAAEEARKAAEASERRRKGAIGMVTIAIENPSLYEQMLELASNTYGPEAIQGLSPTFPGREPLAAFRDSMLTPQERAEMAARERTASIQEGQLGVSQRSAALAEREFGLKERKFGLEERQFDAEQRALVDAAKADAKTGVPAAEIAKREAAFPKASGAFTAATSEIDSLVSDLGKLAKAPGLSSILGGIEGRMPSFFGKAADAQVLYDAIMSRGAFRELAAMREASPTGGALGQVTEKELAMLQSAFGALGQIQSEKSFAKNVKEVVRKLEAAKKNISDVYNATYSYRQSAGGTRTTSSGTSYTVEE